MSRCSNTSLSERVFDQDLESPSTSGWRYVPTTHEKARLYIGEGCLKYHSDSAYDDNSLEGAY
jgi:hypothetical protein